MRHNTCFYCFLLLVLLVTTTSCQAAAQIDPTPTGMLVPPLPTPTATKAPPSCPDASSFGKFWENEPINFNQVPINSVFLWFYDWQGFRPGSIEAWADLCVPSSYTLVFSTGPDYTDEIYVPVINPSLDPDPGKLSVRWTLPDTLEHLKFYRWVAVGEYNDIQIKYNKISILHDDSKWPPQSTLFNESVFFLGPICTSDAIETATLVYPADGQVISTLDPDLTWTYSNCAPENSFLQISKNANLDGLGAGFNSPLPEDYTIQNPSIKPWWHYKITTGYHWPPLPDCTRYYWRISGNNYSLETSSRTFGEWSEIHSFYVDSGSCPTPTPTFLPPTRTPTSSPTATLVPVKPTKTPTLVPPPVVCSTYTDKDTCWSHSECKWAMPVTGGDPACMHK